MSDVKLRLEDLESSRFGCGAVVMLFFMALATSMVVTYSVVVKRICEIESRIGIDHTKSWGREPYKFVCPAKGTENK